MATGTGCVVEIDVGGALNTQYYPNETYHHQNERFYSNVYLHGNLYFDGFTKAFNINDANIGGTEGGYLKVVLDGVGRYIRLYSTA